MNTVALIRRGFSDSLLNSVSCTHEIGYRLGSPFGPVWARARAIGAEFALLIDEAVHLDERVFRVLQRILASSPKVDGLTLGADGFERVYGAPVVSNAAVSQTAHRVPALPAWLALLRLSAWPEHTTDRTPEFFLLGQSGRLRTLTTRSPRIHLDTVRWAEAIMTVAIDALAQDYDTCEQKDDIPPQFRVTIPGCKRSIPECPATPGPLFSVIIPSIRAEYLREAVASVIDQSFDDWEVRIGIDGPKENHRRQIVEVLAEFADDPRVHVRHFEHQGTGPTRRRLAEQSRGRYITTLDDDDRLTPNTLERFARAIDEYPNIPFLRGGTRVFGLVEDYLSPRTRYRVDGISNDLFEVNQPYVVRRDILESFGGFEWDAQLKNAGEDSDLLLKADRKGYPIHLIDEPLYERRLSTLNQTLDCSAEECLQHVRNLYQKHNPADWALTDVHLTGAGSIVNMSSLHVSAEQGLTVVCATKFMNFQQVGSREGVVIDLEVTSLCNAVCTFCPREHLERSTRYIELEKVRTLADVLKEEATPTVVLCGIGESTLHPKLEEIVGILAGAGVNVCMTTNGSKLSTDLVERLVALGLRELNVSLNATTPDMHAALMKLKNFDRIVERCAEIADQSARWPTLQLHVSFVLTEQNQAQVDEFVNTWDRAGVTRIWLHPLTNRSGLLATDCRPADVTGLDERFADRARVLVDLFPENDGPVNLCRIAHGIDFISVEGDMLLCAQDYRARHRFGNLDHAPIAVLHQSKVLQHMRGMTAETCSTCSFCPSGFTGGGADTYTIVQAGVS